MFDIFSRSKDYQLPKKENIEDYQVSEKPSKPIENYRVGITEDGYTTLTLISGTMSSTMYLTPGSCERLIRMLRSTYESENEVEE